MVAATLGTRDEQNPFTAELAAMSRALDALPLQLQYGNITILTRNKAATQAVSRPHHQSGQEDIRRIYATIGKLRSRGNSVSIRWIPTGTEGDLTRTAKGAAKRSANPQKLPVRSPYRAASTTLAAARKDQADCQTLPDEVGKYSKRIGTALPGKHTRRIYDALTAAQARVLAQLRTGMIRLNGYLWRIGAAPSNKCPCGQAVETADHFLFRCTRWTSQRVEMQQETGARTGSLSFHLGGKARTDADDWTPDMAAVQATIKHAIATARLDEGRQTT